ncbi:LysR family transcriptional regulator [Marinobacterium arenosum]|uniref:LysR family transcriptional regulator n=1 Tax=Marinobacterium arenosum TaxID=2862496 RepID=UPI001C9527DF|nr:LysR family transcriptional regulator [Marinobacterium arenosum]MBY4678375.1 LysR family transcriptional regulator [Marinobacterium arenosum]
MHHWESIEAFVRVAEQGSFSAAANRMRVSSSHVSRLISRLEARLNSQLLYRTTRKVTLTETGRLFYEHCCHLVDAVENAEQQIAKLNDEPRGLLRITCGTTFGERFIVPMMNQFMQQNPGLELQFHLTNRPVDLISEGYDLAIRTGVLKDSSLVARRLSERREYIVASPDYVERQGAPQTPAELQRHNCLVGTKNSWTLNQDGQRKEFRVSGNWQANSGFSVLSAALAGIGIGNLPDYYVEPYLADNRLVELLADYRCKEAAIWAIYPKSRHLSPKIRQCVDFLVEKFANPDWRTQPI